MSFKKNNPGCPCCGPCVPTYRLILTNQADGSFVAGATVEALDAAGTVLASGTTDTSGEWVYTPYPTSFLSVRITMTTPHGEIVGSRGMAFGTTVGSCTIVHEIEVCYGMLCLTAARTDAGAVTAEALALGVAFGDGALRFDGGDVPTEGPAGTFCNFVWNFWEKPDTTDDFPLVYWKVKGDCCTLTDIGKADRTLPDNSLAAPFSCEDWSDTIEFTRDAVPIRVFIDAPCGNAGTVTVTISKGDYTESKVVDLASAPVGAPSGGPGSTPYVEFEPQPIYEGTYTVVITEMSRGFVAGAAATVEYTCGGDLNGDGNPIGFAGVSVGFELDDGWVCGCCLGRALPETLHASDSYGSCDVVATTSSGGVWRGSYGWTDESVRVFGCAAAPAGSPATATIGVELTCATSSTGTHTWTVRKYALTCLWFDFLGQPHVSPATGDPFVGGGVVASTTVTSPCPDDPVSFETGALTGGAVTPQPSPVTVTE